MLIRLKQALTPPTMVDEEQTRVARIVHTIIVALVLIALVVIAADLTIGYLVGIPSLVIGLGLGLLAWGVLRRGQLSAAALLVLLTTLGVVTVQLYIGQGIHDPTVSAYPVLVMLASLVFDRRRFIVFTVLALLSLGGIVLAELLGLVYEAFPGATTWYDFVVAASILILAAIGARLLADDLTHNLSKARRELAERTRIEAALRDSETRYRSYVEQSTEGLMLIDEGGVVSEWNHAQEIITGLTRAEVVGWPQWTVQGKLVAPDRRTPELEARWQASILDALKTGRSPLFERPVEAVLETPGGERRHIQQSIFPIKTEHGWRLGVMTLDVTDRKRMEETLRQSEASLAEAQRISHFGSWTWDLSTNQLQCSDEMFRIAGVLPQAVAVTQDAFLKFMPADDVTWLLQQIQHGPTGKLPDGLEHRLVRPNGEIRDVYSRAKVYYDEHGRPLRLLGSTQDITERKQVEAALRVSEDRFRSLVQNASDIITVHKADGTIVYESPSAARVLGYAAGGLIGRNPIELIHPDDAQLLQTNWQEVVDQHTDGQPTELRFHRADGEWLYLEVIGKNLLEHPGIRGIVVTARDVTERRRAEHALRQYVERLTTLHLIDQAILSEQPIGVIAQAALSRVQRLVSNQRAEVTLFEAQTGEAIVVAGLLDGEVKPLDVHFPLSAVEARDALRRGQVHVEPDVTRLSEPSPEERRMLARGSRSYVAAPLIVKGDLIGVLNLESAELNAFHDELSVVIREVADQLAIAIQQAWLFEQNRQHAAELEQRVADRTRELTAANEQLTELDRLKSKFVSDVSHELRTPIANLKLYAGLLERGKPEKLGHYRTVLKQQTQRLSQLVEDILDLSRLEIAKQHALFGPVDLYAVIDQIVTAHQPRAEAAGLALTFAAADDLPPVRGDIHQLTQVMTNLIVNALNYTSQGGVQVTLTATDGHMRVGVVDSGQGIASDDLPHIFERFYRGRQARQRDVPGTGLGLAIVKEIVELHHGSITVDSRVDQGTTFRVDLPVNL
ncbi:MAG: PAS domain S-box protein [Chloroflexi bacterium]|nr:PAS domain S-box protein [Chloroflexota bacterium]